MTTPVSVTIVTFNEERNIRDCLESVSWADEIIVIDSFSSDATVSICREYAAKVFIEPWEGFAATKQKALDRAAHRWVLSLDADERITKNLRDEIIDALDNVSKDVAGFFIPRRNFFGGVWVKYGGWFPDYTMRLVDKSRSSFPPRAVHEAISVKGATRRLKEPMLHYTYRTISDYIERMQRYTSLGARDVTPGPIRLSLPMIYSRRWYSFIRRFFFQRGFLDGRLGLILADLHAMQTYVKYLKARELYKKRNRPKDTD